MTTAFFLLEDVDLSGEVGVRGDRAGNGNDLTALNLIALGATEEETTVLACPCFVHGLVEHFDTGNGGLLRFADTEDFNLRVDRELATLNTTGDNGATAGDGEDVFDRHEERLVHVALGGRHEGVDCFHELFDLSNPLRIAFESLQSGNLDDRGVAIEVLGLEQVAAFFLNELQHFLIVDHIGLVEGNQDRRNADLASKQNVLAGLSHRAVGGGDNEDCAVHLSCTGDHVLDVVGVAGGVDVCVVTRLGLVLDVGNVNRNATLTLFRSVVDVFERGELVQFRVLVVQNLGDCCGKRGLAVVNVTDGTDVDVRLAALELGLRHLCPPGLG